jgi:hypothetical protein
MREFALHRNIKDEFYATKSEIKPFAPSGRTRQ